MILAVRVDGQMLIFEPKTTEEAIELPMHYHKQGKYVDYWNIIQEGSPVILPTYM